MISRRFAIVAVGGTFDHFHKGHEALISKCFEVGHKVIIGVTSDDFAEKLGKKVDRSYSARVSLLKKFIQHKFPNKEYEIHELNDYFGPAVIDGDVQAIVVTPETLSRVKIANALRKKRSLKPLETVLIAIVPAKDGAPISSTRIREGKIDQEGRVLKTK